MRLRHNLFTAQYNMPKYRRYREFDDIIHPDIKLAFPAQGGDVHASRGPLLHQTGDIL